MVGRGLLNCYSDCIKRNNRGAFADLLLAAVQPYVVGSGGSFASSKQFVHIFLASLRVLFSRAASIVT